MRITITEQHISKAIMAINKNLLAKTNCPISQALRELNLKGDIYVESDKIIINDGMLTTYRSLPPAARKFIFNFDCLREVEPFRFEIIDLLYSI